MSEVHARVIEAGHHQAAGGIERRGLRRGPPSRLALVAHGEDAAIADCHRAGGRIGQRTGTAGAEDAAVVDDQVGGHRVGLAGRAPQLL